MKYNENELTLLWIDSFLTLSYVEKQFIYGLINGKSEIKKVLEQNKLALIDRLTEEKALFIINSATKEYFERVIKELDELGIKAVTVVSKEYPVSLLQTEEPPLVLYAKGNLELLKEKCFGIVGSRKSLPIAISLTKEYATTLQKVGFTLVTGIAEGVDKAVIDSVIDSGKIISVIAGGFKNIYPKSHTKLFEKICEKGLAISEQPPSFVPMRFSFPVRNRIIAGLSEGVLIASGSAKSGTKYTAVYAEEYGKDVFAIPYSVGISSGEICNELIKSGAFLTDTPKDILDRYNLGYEQEEISLTDKEKQIVEILKGGSAHVNAVMKGTGLSVSETTTILSSLIIKGVVTNGGANVYGLARKITED